MSSLAGSKRVSTNLENAPVLPLTAAEVNAILVFPHEGQQTCIGDVEDNFTRLPSAIVYLGTHVSEKYPSMVGFRVLLRKDRLDARRTRKLEDSYCVITCRFLPEQGAIEHHDADASDLLELMNLFPDPVSFLSVISESLHRIDFMAKGHGAIKLSRLGSDMRTTQALNLAEPSIQQVDRTLESLSGAEKVSLFFKTDPILVSYLNRVVDSNCIGEEVPHWGVTLPESAVPSWPSNVQTRMVTGSINVLNFAYNTLLSEKLKDGPGTSPKVRRNAQKFREFVRGSYPAIPDEQGDRVHPIMLNVVDSLCIELPFGGSFMNRPNTCAAISAVHKLLDVGVRGVDIGIVTLYPAQVEAYQEILRWCHEREPTKEYRRIKVALLEDLIDHEMEIILFDMVRTANFSGNLGYLSQARRMKIALLTHRNGLIIVGAKNCAVNAYGGVTSVKLDKVFQWLGNNNRIVDVSGQALQEAPVPQVTETGPLPAHADSRSVVSMTTSDKVELPKAPDAKAKGSSNQHIQFQEERRSKSRDRKAAAQLSYQRQLAKQWGVPMYAVIESFKIYGLEYSPLDADTGRSLASQESFARQLVASRLANHNNPQGVPPNVADLEFEPSANLIKASKNEFTGPAPKKENKDPKRSTKFAIENELPHVHQGLSAQNSTAASRIAQEKTKTPPPSPKVSLGAGSKVLSPQSPNRPITLTSQFNKKMTLESPHQFNSPRNPEPSSRQAKLNAQQNTLDFKNQYRAKYQAIRGMFDALHDPENINPREDKLFRRLADAFVLEERDDFDKVYSELLDLARGLHMGGPAAGSR